MSEGLPNVNQETLELLQRRIESKIRSNLFKTVTLPIGGGGIIAIVIAVVAWIPTQIKSILNDDYVKEQVTAVADEEVRKRVLEKLDTVVADRMEKNVKTFLEGEEGAKLLAAEVNKSVKEYLTSEDGLDVLAAEVERVFQDQQVRDLVSKTVGETATAYIEGDLQEVIKQTVRDELKPTVAAAALKVREKSEELVTQFVGTAEASSIRIAKGSHVELNQVKDQADEIRGKELPVILTKNVGVPDYYVREVVKAWIDTFREEFPEQFQHVAILHGDERGRGQFVALVPHEEFEKKLDESDDLMALLRMKMVDISFEETQTKVRDMFGPLSTRRIELTDTVKRTLRNPEIWLTGTKPTDRVAVVDPERNDLLVGLTSRETLEESLFAGVHVDFDDASMVTLSDRISPDELAAGAGATSLGW